MQIHELQLRHDLKNIWSPQRILGKHGWKVLGWGLEAAVAEHPTKPYVLKLYYNSSKYSRFVDFVRENPTSPYLPKFSRYVRELPGEWMYVRMEKLTPVSEDKLLTRYFPQIVVLSWLGIQRHFDGLSRLLNQEVIELAGTKGLDLNDPSTTLDTIQSKLGKVTPEWIRVCQALLDHAKSTGIGRGLDLHPGNFMKRGNVIVITDPYV